MNENIEQWVVRKQAVSSADGVVAAQHELAARAGAGLLAAGGNAIDAALAAAFALAAVEPWMCGLGGSGYMVIWIAAEQRAYVLDFQGQLPADIRASDYPLDAAGELSLMGFPQVSGNRNVAGYGSILIPGAVAGFDHALRRFGSQSWSRVIEPAIELATRGLPVNWFTTLNISLAMTQILADPAAAKIYLRNGVPVAPEQFIPMGKLAATLQTLANEGAEAFYHGSIAASMSADLHAGGSRISAQDFAAYEVLEHAPLSATLRGVSVHTAGPTSGGQRLIDALTASQEHLAQGAPLDAHAWEVYADALNAAWRSHKIRTGLMPQTQGCTSHLSSVDRHGNMVALTYTLLNRFGSGVVLPGSGVLMNNSVSYFDPRPGNPVSMSGGKRINSSNMCPVIASEAGAARFALGASGANQIMPCTMLLSAMLLNHRMSIEDAFNHPRIDASDRGSIRVDPALGQTVIDALRRRHTLELAQRLTFPKLYACPSGVSRDPANGLCHGISDPSQPIANAAPAGPFSLEPATEVLETGPRA